MSSTETTTQVTDRTAGTRPGAISAPEPDERRRHGPRPHARRRIARMVAGGLLGVLALIFVAGGGWALWNDRVDRDANGFVPIGSATLRTPTYAIVGNLHGSGPRWLWESGVLGHSRARATSQVPGPLFIGIARTSDVFRYLCGAGYATIDSFQVRADTTHAGGPPPGPPSSQPIWAASTQGTGRQTLRWDSRAGNWSIVFMNAGAAPDVVVHGDASAKFPILPWLAGGLLLAAAVTGVSAGWVLWRAGRREDQPVAVAPDRAEGSPTTRTPIAPSI